MLDFSFKVKETTKGGKLLKKLLSDNNVDAPILLNNTCPKCTNDVQGTAPTIECSICLKKYHAPCLTPSLSSDTLTALSANPCLWWFCGTCVKNASKCDDGTSDSLDLDHQVNQVDLMNSISKQFSEQFSVLKTELVSSMETFIEDKISSIIPENVTLNKDPKPALFSDHFTPSSNEAPIVISQVPQPPQVPLSLSPEVLVLTPKENETVNANTMHNVKKFVQGKLKNSPVEFVRCNDNNKKVSIGFVNKEARDTAAALINSGQTLESYGYLSKNAKKMLPKVTIKGISSEVLDDIDTSGANNDENKIRDLEKHQIVMKIIEKNPLIKELYDQDHTLSVVYLCKSTRVRGQQEYIDLTVALKVSPSIRRVLFGKQHNASIYLGNHRYNVDDHFHTTQCYHCQLVGHTSVDCNDVKTGKPPVCMYCAGNHRSKNCTTKRNKDTHCCARCLASKHGDDAEKSRTHNAGSLDCPVLKRETIRLASNTDYTSKNAM